jgi:hypothetical protein
MMVRQEARPDPGFGAAGAVVGKLVTNATLSALGQSRPAHFVAAVVGGGIGSKAAGGSFENGAFSAGLGYALNQAMSKAESPKVALQSLSKGELNLSIGLGGQYMMGVPMASGDIGFTFNVELANLLDPSKRVISDVCGYVNVCGSGVGLGAGGGAGLVGQLQTGLAQTGTQISSGAYIAGGEGFFGEGSVQVGMDGNLAGGKGIIGVGGGIGAGLSMCGTAYYCASSLKSWIREKF